MFPVFERLPGFCLQQVISGIHAKGQFIIVRKTVGDFPVDVVKGIAHVLFVIGIGTVEQEECRSCEKICPTSSHGYVERGLVFYDRAFKLDSAIEQPQGESPVKLLHVPLFGAYIHYGRKSAAVTCRETAFIEIHVFDNIRIESGEQPAQMVDLVKRCSVQQKKVLIVLASVYIHAGKQLRSGSHTGNILEGLYQVR